MTTVRCVVHGAGAPVGAVASSRWLVLLLLSVERDQLLAVAPSGSRHSLGGV
jgi:hypothetical protein